MDNREELVKHEEEIDNLLKIHWWGEKIGRPVIDSWLENFGDDIDVGNYIIRNIIYYTSNQIESYVSQIILQMQADYYSKMFKKCEGDINEEALYNMWIDSMKKTRFVPLEKRVDAGTSATIIIRKLRSVLRDYYDGEGNFVSKPNLIEENLRNGVDTIVFVDDFSGTGNQLHQFLNDDIEISGKTVKIRELPDIFPDVSFQFFVLVMHEKSREKNKDDLMRFEMRCVETVCNDLDMRDANCALYTGLSEEKRKHIAEYIVSKSELIQQENTKYRKVDKYQLGLPIVFEHGCPNNSCLLLFAKTENWNKLFSLGEENA